MAHLVSNDSKEHLVTALPAPRLETRAAAMQQPPQPPAPQAAPTKIVDHAWANIRGGGQRLTMTADTGLTGQITYRRLEGGVTRVAKDAGGQKLFDLAHRDGLLAPMIDTLRLTRSR